MALAAPWQGLQVPQRGGGRGGCGVGGASKITESGLEAWEQIQDRERNGCLHFCSALAVLRPGISLFLSLANSYSLCKAQLQPSSNAPGKIGLYPLGIR